MARRVIASSLFTAGGAVTWFIITVMKAYAFSQAAMSAGPVSGKDASDAAVLWLACAYFLISAVSAAAMTNKKALWILWCLAHTLVIIAFAVLVSEASDWERDKFISAFLTLALIFAVFFSPWLAIWAWVLRKANSPVCPGSAEK